MNIHETHIDRSINSSIDKMPFKLYLHAYANGHADAHAIYKYNIYFKFIIIKQ